MPSGRNGGVAACLTHQPRPASRKWPWVAHELISIGFYIFAICADTKMQAAKDIITSFHSSGGGGDASPPNLPNTLFAQCTHTKKSFLITGRRNKIRKLYEYIKCNIPIYGVCRLKVLANWTEGWMVYIFFCSCFFRFSRICREEKRREKKTVAFSLIRIRTVLCHRNECQKNATEALSVPFVCKCTNGNMGMGMRRGQISFSHSWKRKSVEYSI